MKADFTGHIPLNSTIQLKLACRSLHPAHIFPGDHKEWLFGQENTSNRKLLSSHLQTCKPQNYPVAAAAVTICQYRKSTTGVRPPSV